MHNDVAWEVRGEREREREREREKRVALSLFIGKWNRRETNINPRGGRENRRSDFSYLARAASGGFPRAESVPLSTFNFPWLAEEPVNSRGASRAK